MAAGARAAAARAVVNAAEARAVVRAAVKTAVPAVRRGRGSGGGGDR